MKTIAQVFKFVIHSFWPKNAWGQLLKDNERYGRWSLVIVGGRAILMLNGLVLPVTMITHEKVRIVTIIVDMLLLPILAILSAVIARYIEPEQKGWYTSQKFQSICTAVAIAYAIFDEFANLNAGGLRRAHMFKPVAIAHNLLFPL